MKKEKFLYRLQWVYKLNYIVLLEDTKKKKRIYSSIKIDKLKNHTICDPRNMHHIDNIMT